MRGYLAGGIYRGTTGVCIQACAGTGRFGKFGTTSIPAPETSASSVRYQYRHRKLRQVRYDINTGTGNFGKFGTASIPVPEASVSSVRRTGTYFRIGAGHFGKFGTPPAPVPDTSVSSVRRQYRYWTRRQVRYNIHAGNENTGTVPNTPLEDCGTRHTTQLEVLRTCVSEVRCKDFDDQRAASCSYRFSLFLHGC